ncbi:MAG: DUF262 domain-containing protein [Candidatus Thiothrix sulfatifontis]|nr:MAG: DUF262 domain-containing protein [Candidatus Thiothrix sulfatifontis]
MEVKVISCTFSDLINTYNKAILGTDIKGQLSIPEYQRPYVWKEKQINRILDDLIEHKKNTDSGKSLFYLGSIIVHQDGNKLKIIDGQQRITTMLLINSIVDKTFKSGIEYTSTISINNIKNNYAYLKSVYSKDIFNYAHVELNFNNFFNEVNVTLVVTSTEDLAYTFFETQNTGGVRLSGSDIIKAHHLRAVKSKKIINHQAKKWESIESERIEYIIQNLSKIRFWDNRNWRDFPFYRDEKGIKSVLIEEFTENTKHDFDDVSYYYSVVKIENGRVLQMHESHYKQLKQPLSDGNNTLDYINDYVGLHEILFNGIKKDYRISDDFYKLTIGLMHGHSGTLFLKELLEIFIITYVSRFGFFRLFEVSLWFYRSIYSLRVSNKRNVKEDSVHKFVRENKFIDSIVYAYTIDELVSVLRKFKYNFDTSNTEKNQSKYKHLETLKNYFQEFKEINTYVEQPKDFDKTFMIAIFNKIKEEKANEK